MRQAQTILGAAGASEEDESEGGTVELVLYYTPPWPSSMKARRNLEKILGGYAPDTVHLTLRDLAEHPDLAEADGVVFSPTLIKKSPGAPVWMLGDLSDATGGDGPAARLGRKAPGLAPAQLLPGAARRPRRPGSRGPSA